MALLFRAKRKSSNNNHMIEQITNATEAYDYIYYVAQNQMPYNEEMMNKAKSYFHEMQLRDMNLDPDIILNDCFDHNHE